MTFSESVKAELCRTHLNRSCCALAEAYGILLCCNTFSAERIRIITENTSLASRLPVLFRRAFQLEFDRQPDPERGERKKIFLITDRSKLEYILEQYGKDVTDTAHHINFGVLEENCCRASFLRGVFLAGGSVSDPRGSYHLEITTSHLAVSKEMLALMWEMDQEPKLVQRKGSAVIYFKQSEKIADFLTCIGAPISALEVINAKVEKDMRGSINRAVNCDAANLDKVMDAALTQVMAIRALEDRGVLDTLPDKLQEAARLRLDHPEDTLTRLAERCVPPVTKSALNHRLRRLVQLAQEADAGGA